VPYHMIDYPEVVGKVVAKVTLTNEDDFRCVTVRFTDKTAIHFELKLRLEVVPEFMDWTTGDGKSLRMYKTVREQS
jgi:hypothetical protein